MSRFHSCLLAIASLVVWLPRADAQTFTVSVVNGQALIATDRSSYQTAVPKSSHAIPSWGKTGDESSLTIAFNAENKFRLLPNSEAEVTTGGESDSGSAWHRVVSLKIGTAHFDHNAGTAPVVHLDCQTPTAVCGAVGTEYQVDATKGEYTVSSGHISVTSPDMEGALSMTDVGAGGDVTYNPGQENTFSQASFTGTVVIDGKTFHASDADFTVAKLRDSSSETAVHIGAGKIGTTGPGDYVMDGGTLSPVTGKAATIHPQYLAAARKEGALNTLRAADKASHRTFGQQGDLDSATADATRLRKELFNRATIREVNKQVTQAVINQATQAAAQAAAAQAAEAAARAAARPTIPGR